MNYENLATEFGTPLYIYDFDKISARYKELKQAFLARKSLICYAVKTNSNLSVLKHLAGLGAGFDCVSIGEVKRALMAGGAKYKIIFSGVGKRDDEIKEALLSDILFINLESYEEMLAVENIAKTLDKKARISVRVNPNVDPKTHPYISTGLKKNKFGVSIEDARAIYIHAHKSEFLDPVGIHFHIGSQLIDISPVHEAALIVSNFMAELCAASIDIKFFDVGGGVGVRYTDEVEPNLYEYAQGILAALKNQDKTIIIEPGRYIAANSGELLTKVLYEKVNENKRFVVVDSAMNDLLRPSLYEAVHEICAPYKSGENSPCDVVGAICESGDFLGKDVLLPPLKSGDLLSIKSAGAYGFSMSSNYNSRTRAAEVGIKDGKARLIRQRESFDDLIALEKGFL